MLILYGNLGPSSVLRITVALMNEKERQFACFEVEGKSIAEFEAMLGHMVTKAEQEFSGVFVEDIKLATTNMGGGVVRYSGVLLLQVDRTF